MAAGTLTLLQVVQKTLEAMGSDDVNSISDSVEATQIAQLAEDAFYEILNQKEWPFLQKLRQLEPLADADYPNYLKIPAGVVRIDHLKYDVTDPNDEDAGAFMKWVEVNWVTPTEFVDEVQTRNTLDTTITVITDLNGVKLPIYSEQDPSMWTSFDDKYIVFDAWRSDIESTLQANRSQAQVVEYPDFSLDDDFIPDWPVHMFQLWLAEVKSTAFIYMRQEASPKDEQRARRGLAVLRRSASRTNEDDGKVRFGRRV
jgi:hypothetical protein